MQFTLLPKCTVHLMPNALFLQHLMQDALQQYDKTQCTAQMAQLSPLLVGFCLFPIPLNLTDC